MTEYVITDSQMEMIRATIGHIEPQGEVVRCRDCVNYRDSLWVVATDVSDACTFFSDGVKVEADGFCAWGERR